MTRHCLGLVSLHWLALGLLLHQLYSADNLGGYLALALVVDHVLGVALSDHATAAHDIMYLFSRGVDESGNLLLHLHWCDHDKPPLLEVAGDWLL